MHKITRHIPNFITSLNLVSGSLAIIFAVDGHLIWAGIFICAAAVFDFMDGFAARLLKSYSEVGKQLDSLADVVSFGLAPGAILFTLLEFSMFNSNQRIYEISAPWYEWLILFSAFLIPVFGALRLAKFNVNTSGESFFRGLPIPANGIFWASLGLMLELPRYQELFQHLYTTTNLFILNVFFSALMVSDLPMFSLKFTSLRFGENWYRFVFIGMCLVLFSLFTFYGIALSIAVYILLNVIFYLFRLQF